jgi:hypothetical protein
MDRKSTKNNQKFVMMGCVNSGYRIVVFAFSLFRVRKFIKIIFSDGLSYEIKLELHFSIQNGIFPVSYTGENTPLWVAPCTLRAAV